MNKCEQTADLLDSQGGGKAAQVGGNRSQTDVHTVDSQLQSDPFTPAHSWTVAAHPAAYSYPHPGENKNQKEHRPCRRTQQQQQLLVRVRAAVKQLQTDVM